MKGILLNSILLCSGVFALLCVRGNAHVVHAGFFGESWKLPVANEVEQEKKISFMNDIAPVFVQHCQGCHGPEKSKGRFRLDTFHHLTKDETVLVKGRPEESLLFQLIHSDDPDDRMPVDADPLSVAQIDLIGKWISQGMNFDGPDPMTPIADALPVQLQKVAPDHYNTLPPIHALAFDKTGELIFVGGYGEVLLWDRKEKGLLNRFQPAPEKVTQLLHDGSSNTLFVSGGSPGRGGWIVSFDLDQDNPLPRVLLQKSETIWCIQLVQAQEAPLHILAGCSDGSVVQLDAATGAVIQDYPLHADWVLKMDYRPESGRLATASRDHTARVIDVSNWTQVSAWRGASQPVSGVVWLPDGKSLVSVGPGSGLDRWDVESADRKGKSVDVKAQWPQLWVFPKALWAVTDAVDCVQIDPTNLDIKKRFQLDASRGRILSLTGSREHNVLALGHISGVITILDASDGKELEVIEPFPCGRQASPDPGLRAYL